MAYATGDEGGPLRLDTAALQRILCYGDVGISDEAFQILFANDIEVAWLSYAGQRYRGRLVRSDSPFTSLRLIQHQVLSQPELQRDAAVRLVQAKILSQRTAAHHYLRHGCQDALDVRNALDKLAERCPTASLAEVRGLEGAASAAWFGLFGKLLREPWTFPGRVRRPPTDPVNALLSLISTFLVTRVATRCEVFGLEVNLGALHEFRSGRPSLACDLMEPFRAPAVDRWVISQCNQNRFGPGDFEEDHERGGLRLRSKPFHAAVRGWEEHWLSGDLEPQLDRALQTFIAWLREQAGRTNSTFPVVEEGFGD